ncbi:MAG TPA: hypothetical protein VF184_12240 [Phycisphaeraceae bacterium]
MRSLHHALLHRLALIVLALGVSASPAGTRAASPVEAPEALRDQLRQAEPGGMLDVTGLIEGNGTAPIPLFEVERRDAPGPQFLISDKPEYFRTGDGIALQEPVEAGTVRLYVYHVPEPTESRKTITAVIENTGSQPMRFRFLRYAFPEPGKDYQKIAKQALVTFLKSQPSSTTRTVAPGQRMVIDPAMDRRVVGKDDLVHGFYEFEIDQPGIVTVFQKNPEEDSRRVIDRLPKLPPVLPGWHPSGAGRGWFAVCNFEVEPKHQAVYDTAQGVMQILVADGEHDPWITGRDSITGQSDVPNKGNYGVMYRIRIPYRTSDGRALAVIVYNPRGGGKWCNAQALAVRVNDGRAPAGVIEVPANQVRYNSPPEAALVQCYPPQQAGQTGIIEITYSPPGASCLPVPFVLVPFSP